MQVFLALSLLTFTSTVLDKVFLSPLMTNATVLVSLIYQQTRHTNFSNLLLSIFLMILIGMGHHSTNLLTPSAIFSYCYVSRKPINDFYELSYL